MKPLHYPTCSGSDKMRCWVFCYCGKVFVEEFYMSSSPSEALKMASNRITAHIYTESQ